MTPVRALLVAAGVVLSAAAFGRGALAGGRGAAEWIRAEAMASRHGFAAFPRHAVRAGAASPLAPLTAADRALVLVFSPACELSGANMNHWMDLLGELRGRDVPVYAVGTGAREELAAYWDGLESRVALLAAEPGEIHAALGVAGTPATLVVRRGRVVAAAGGLMTPATARQVLDLVTRP